MSQSQSCRYVGLRMTRSKAWLDKPGEPGKPGDMINILKSQGEPGKVGENFKNSSSHGGVREVFLIKLINLFLGCFF